MLMGRKILLSLLPKLTFRFSVIIMKILTSYVMGINKAILRFIWRGKRSKLADKILKEKN